MVADATRGVPQAQFSRLKIQGEFDGPLCDTVFGIPDSVTVLPQRVGAAVSRTLPTSPMNESGTCGAFRIE
jgi:hypothetical protein